MLNRLWNSCSPKSKKVAKGLFISMGGAGLAYLSGIVETSSLDPLVAVLFANIINLVKVKYFS